MLCVHSSSGELITSPGEWKRQTEETIYIKCIDAKKEANSTFCQVSVDGSILQIKLLCTTRGDSKS